MDISFFFFKSEKTTGALVAHQVKHVPLKLSPYCSGPGLSPAQGPLLHLIPSFYPACCVFLSHLKFLI